MWEGRVLNRPSLVLTGSRQWPRRGDGVGGCLTQSNEIDIKLFGQVNMIAELYIKAA